MDAVCAPIVRRHLQRRERFQTTCRQQVGFVRVVHPSNQVVNPRSHWQGGVAEGQRDRGRPCFARHCWVHYGRTGSGGRWRSRWGDTGPSGHAALLRHRLFRVYRVQVAQSWMWGGGGLPRPTAALGHIAVGALLATRLRRCRVWEMAACGAEQVSRGGSRGQRRRMPVVVLCVLLPRSCY